MQKFCVIQTAFIGDVVLSTSLIASLHLQYPAAQIDIVVRKGNESLFTGHPYIHNVIVWDKKQNKYLNWIKVLKQIRSKQYDSVINVQRFAATGLWTALSNATHKIGFDKNPFSFLFTHKIKHETIHEGHHEIHKNHALIQALNPAMVLCHPQLYPTQCDIDFVKQFQQQPYICIAPASVWFTKRFPIKQWIQFLNELNFDGKVYIIGGPGDKNLGDEIINSIHAQAPIQGKVVNLAGQLSFLSSAALQSGAVLSYVNDSAPMHFASAVNAPVVAIFCSTIPAFGFGPLSDKSFIVETQQQLSCKPCGIHGRKACPLNHFNCGNSIQMEQLYAPLVQMKQH